MAENFAALKSQAHLLPAHHLAVPAQAVQQHQAAQDVLAATIQIVRIQKTYIHHQMAASQI